MNQDQLFSIVRTLLKAGAGALVTHGAISSSNSELLIAVVMAVVGVLWSHVTHQGDDKQGNLPLNLLLLAFVAIGVTGCGTVYQSNKITAVKERGFGIVVAQSAANQTPEVKLGFFSSVVQIIPTSTDGPVSSPRYMDTLDIDSGLNPFGTGIKENTGTGEVMVGSGTNDTSKAIVPSSYVPSAQGSPKSQP